MKTKNKNRGELIGVWVPPELHKKLKEAAVGSDRTISDYVRHVIKATLKGRAQ